MAASSDSQENVVGTTQPGYMANENHGFKFVNDKEGEVKEEATSASEGRGGVEELEEAAAAAAAGGGEKGEIASAAGDELEKQYWKYLPLYKATLRGDWEESETIIEKDKDALTAMINQDKETALHLAVGTGKSIDFVKNLVELLPVDALKQTDSDGYTALHTAARFGNTEAAKILVQKHEELLYIRESNELLPLHRAAVSAHRETLAYLLTVTKDDHQSMPFAGNSGVGLLILVISAGFYDVALDLVRRYPHVAKSDFVDSNEGRRSRLADADSKKVTVCALGQMAEKVSAFPSVSLSRLTSWQRLLYNYAPVKLENCIEDQDRCDIENPNNRSQVIAQKHDCGRSLRGNFSISGKKKLKAMLWEVLELLVPRIKHLREQKLMHDQALQLVKCLCWEIRSLKDLKSYELLVEGPLLAAARLGIREIVEEIVDTFPRAIFAMDSQRSTIFHLAVIHRHENVFNLLYQMGEYKQYISRFEDNRKDVILHLAGRLAPPEKLNLIPGAALQMQRELQWFKEVEKFVNPSHIERKNKAKETPSMLFTKTHKELVVKGEKWMKERASSCTVVAALIATIVFATAITVPGGNNGISGHPIFSKEKAFYVFVISDAISLFTSTTSLLIFLSILTSRYAESDFLYTLPNRLIIGLVTLFLSITTMILAFCSALYLAIGYNKAWILIPVVALACLPIICFVSLQFPLLVDLINSTYGPGIFGKKSNRSFY